MQIKPLLTLFLTATFVLSPLVTPPFSGFTADQLPVPQIEPPIQPAGYAFAIWGLIYGWLCVSAGYGLWQRAGAADWNRARPALIASLAVGTPWLWVAGQSPVWATVLIFAMAVTAIAALWLAPRRDKWWFRTPVAIYAGWLTAASFVSLGSTMAGYGILTDAQGWAYIGIGLALAVALFTQFRAYNAPGYGLTVIWALVGIIVANQAVNAGVSAMAGAGILVLLGALILDRRWRLAA
jgi:flagellin-like protein